MPGKEWEIYNYITYESLPLYNGPHHVSMTIDLGGTERFIRNRYLVYIIFK